jgi:hypothetical protein
MQAMKAAQNLPQKRREKAAPKKMMDEMDDQEMFGEMADGDMMKEEESKPRPQQQAAFAKAAPH